MNNRLEELPLSATTEEDDNASLRSASRFSDDEPKTHRRESASSKQTKSKSFSKRYISKKIKAKKGSKSRKIQEIEVNCGEERANMMELFYGNVESLKTSIGSISIATKTINSIAEDILVKGLSSREEKALDMKACNLVEQTKQKAQTIRSQLKCIQKETAQLKNPQASSVLVESDFRIRNFLTSALTKQFVDELRLYQAAQSSYKDRTQQKLKRQIRSVQPHVTDEEIEAMIKGGEDRDTIYQRTILSPGTVNAKIRKVHDTVSEKQKAIEQIEQSVSMVHGLFLDLAFLVEEQGGTLDQIDFHVKQAADYIEQGNEELYKSYQYQTKIRKKKRMILLIVGAVIVVIAVVVIL